MKTPEQIAMGYLIAIGLILLFAIGSALFVAWSSKREKKSL